MRPFTSKPWPSLTTNALTKNEGAADTVSPSRMSHVSPQFASSRKQGELTLGKPQSDPSRLYTDGTSELSNSISVPSGKATLNANLNCGGFSSGEATPSLMMA